MIFSEEEFLKIKNDDHFLYSNINQISRSLYLEDNLTIVEAIKSTCILLSLMIHNSNEVNDDILKASNELIERYFGYLETLEINS
jgi:hypothetical protein